MDVEYLLAHVEDDPLRPFAEKVNWEAFRARLEEIWHGDRSDYPAGRKACDVVLRFKLRGVSCRLSKAPRYVVGAEVSL